MGMIMTATQNTQAPRAAPFDQRKHTTHMSPHWRSNPTGARAVGRSKPSWDVRHWCNKETLTTLDQAARVAKGCHGPTGHLDEEADW